MKTADCIEWLDRIIKTGAIIDENHNGLLVIRAKLIAAERMAEALDILTNTDTEEWLSKKQIQPVLIEALTAYREAGK